MPNTIAHFAINGLFTRAVISHADFKWIYLGCIIPDLPWVLQRIVKTLPLSVDLYDLRAICVVQSSFLLCVLISAAFAMLSKHRSKVFLILVVGCLLHLLLDAVQIKWANGVQLLVPFSWDLLRFDYFWPESMGTYLLMVAGILYFTFNLKRSIQLNCEEFIVSKISLSVSGVLFLAWLILPTAFIQTVYSADNHFISTLKDVRNRAGKNIEIDRNSFFNIDGVSTLVTSYGEHIRLENIQADEGVIISLQGRFSDISTIYVDNYHVHSRFRNYASIMGLACVMGVWLLFIFRCYALKFNRP